MSEDRELLALALQCVRQNQQAGRRVATAESCTGGLVAAMLTAIPGASGVLDRGFVTYSNRAKTEMLGVAAQTIAAHGAVSEEVARAMAAGALRNSAADAAVAVSGVAGPGGGSAEKPVGMVVFARAVRQADGAAVVSEACRFDAELGRREIRRQAVMVALRLLLP